MSLLALALSAATVLQAQGETQTCPWCKNDPKLLAAAGCVSHGPMMLGTQKSDALAKSMPGKPWIFLETTHVRFGSSLGQETVTLKERPRVEAELARLRKALPSIPMKVAVLDPWLRLHLTAMKTEEFYARFQQLLRVKDADFPEGRTNEGPFMGDGRYLGEKDKFEVALHSNRKTHQLFTKDGMGVVVRDALRWHFKSPSHKLTASIPAEDSDLSQDRYLFPHLVHNFTHLMFCAYKHYSWDPPIWIDEGLAHAMELEMGNDVNITYCSEEGAAPDRDPSQNWTERAQSILARGKAPALADLMARKTFGDLKKEDHVIAWSKVRFLLGTQGDKFAQFLGTLKGRLDEKGYPTGADLAGAQRTLLREIFGWSPDQLDREWSAWVAKSK